MLTSLNLVTSFVINLVILQRKRALIIPLALKDWGGGGRGVAPKRSIEAVNLNKN